MRKWLTHTLLTLLVVTGVALAQIAQPPETVTRGNAGVGALTTGIGTDDAGTWLTARVQLTNAQVLALKTTAITIISAPGAQRIVEVLGGMLFFDRAGAYTETGADDNWRLYYNDSGDEAASPVMEMTGFVDASGDAALTFGRLANDTVITGAALTNSPVVLSGVTGGTYDELGGGNASNEVEIVVAYRVWQTDF